MTERFDKAEDAMTRLEACVRDRYRPPAGALLRVAVARHEGKESLLAASVVFVDTPPAQRGGADYGALLLQEEWVAPLESALQRVGQLLGGSWKVSECSVNAQFDHPWEARYNDRPWEGLSGWNEWVLKGRLADASRPSRVPLGEPVLAFGLPPYRSGGAALNEWVWGRRNDGSHDPSWFGEVHIALPDTRTRFVKADWARQSEVYVELELNIPAQDVELQAYFERSGTRDARVMAPNQSMVLPVPDDARAVSLYLVSRARELLAHRYLSALDLRPGDDAQKELLTLQEMARQEIQGGEGIEVEFKPFIKKGHEKEMEVVRTVVAFANTRGGRIYFGVLEKSGVLTGAKGLQEAYNQSPAKAREEFEIHMRKVIGDKVLGAGFKYRCEFVEVSGEPVGVLVVEQGKEPPYSTAEDEVLVRKGSTNKRPIAQTELVELCNRRNVQTDTYLSTFGNVPLLFGP